MEAAIALGAALLPTLIEEIAAALGEGLDEKAATERALERMRARAIPGAVSGEIAERFRAARELGATTVVGPALAYDRHIVERILGNVVLSHEERAALRALIGAA